MNELEQTSLYKTKGLPGPRKHVALTVKESPLLSIST